MAFADPQSITINAVAHSLPRVALGNFTGQFQTNDGLVVEKIAHTSTNQRTRRSIRVDLSKIAADPLAADRNLRYSMSAYLVVDVPITGFTVTEAKYVVDGLLAYLTASSGAKITQFLGGEA